MSTLRRLIGWPVSWWSQQSLRARLTLLATALFSLAVLTGTVLVLILQRYTLLRTLDSTALKTANAVAPQFRNGKGSSTIATTGGLYEMQVVDANDQVIASDPRADRVIPVADPKQLARLREGDRIRVSLPTTDLDLRALGVRAGPHGSLTVIAVTDLKNVNDSVRLLGQVALIGGPLAVLVMALATYGVVALTLRSVGALRHGAADITAAGLSDQRLPVPSAQDEIHRLAVTLNAMLDRIDASTTRQRTFVGDAAHELRSPLASLRVQLEVARRVGPESDLETFLDDVLVDVERLDRLVNDLLGLARLDEAQGSLLRTEPVDLPALIADVVRGYEDARMPVVLTTTSAAGTAVVSGDPDGLRRVGINLIDNATRYARQQVSVTIDSDASSVTLLVTDDGRGIPAGERERVFDRFYRVQASRSRGSGGTGLGLSIVRDVVKAHGGTVRVTDRPDGQPGLQAVVVLPRLR